MPGPRRRGLDITNSALGRTSAVRSFGGRHGGERLSRTERCLVTQPYAVRNRFAGRNRISTRLSSASAIRLSMDREWPS